jgi:tritrans,polycis-undecaprenyl-diphosphate synthase [geranylgeranyl-diphosphate specific]
MNTPQHVAIIMDGNRKWAQKHKLKPWEGHEAGRKALDRLVRYWVDSEVKFLSLYSLSLDNFSKRSSIEKQFLYKLFKVGFTDLLKDKITHDAKIKVLILGKWELIPDKELKALFREVMEKTSGYSNKVLAFYICYDGQDELVEAAKRIAQKYGTAPDKISNEVLKANLFTSGIPPVDLLIRTGGEQRLSGFLLWDASYAELYFTETLFPDSVPATFDAALEEYKNRKRRFGK